MHGGLASKPTRPRRNAIAACVSSLFVLAVPTATFAATVTSCLDNGFVGTLRSRIAAAAEGETIEFAGLNCIDTANNIDLVNSAITITQNSLTIDASAALQQVMINAAPAQSHANHRIFTHTGTGTLTIKHLALYSGAVLDYASSSNGGCIASSGNVTLASTIVQACSAHRYFDALPSKGGAIFAKGNVTLQKSNVSGNFVSGGSVSGGAIYAKGNLDVQDNSVIDNNSASGASAFALGGGVYVMGNLTLSSSSISYNTLITGSNQTAAGGGAYVIGNLTINAGATPTILRNNSATSTLGTASGGGAFALGDFSATGASIISGNLVSATSHAAAGGGLFVAGALTLSKSVISYNIASGTQSLGGGAYVRGQSATVYTTVSYSTIDHNRVYGTFGYGAGLRLMGSYNVIASSTVADNVSEGVDGGVDVRGQGTGVLFELRNSTISGNTAALIGGLGADSANVRLLYSTIAFNTAGSAIASPGIHLSAYFNPIAVNLQSTLIANNADTSAVQSDLTIYERVSPLHLVTFNSGILATPAHNLVRATSVTKLPTDTKENVCPLLGPLRSNGGLTATHALMSHSPAIDAGNNNSMLLAFDQRASAAVNGKTSYARRSGATGLADIGAYEVQQNDIVFNAQFDGCLP